uniref:Protein FAM32A-like n=1 Tax=Kalanchoe fedtschenkoi TaxID=63787 RepID=A0A7N0RGT9_KALFE
MSSYENVIGGKLKLKGKPLDVKAGGVRKKKKHKKQLSKNYELIKNDLSEGQAIDPNSDEVNDDSKLNEEGGTANIDDQLTPAERRYIEQRERIDSQRLGKTANKSHRDRIEDFNQYLANMSEHYDIPKVGPG